MEYIYLLVLIAVINVAFWIVGIRALSGLFNRKMNVIVTTIHDGMQQRDGELARIKAMVSRAIVTDTKFFDDALGMLDEYPEETGNGREEEDQE
jgi:hypothetical protein